MTTFDAVLDKYIGPLGRWQLLAFIVVNLTLFGNQSGFPQLASLTPDHNCAVPSLERAGLSASEIRRLAIPLRQGQSPNVTDDVCYFESCFQYKVVPNASAELNVTIERNRTVPCQHGWTYDAATAPFRSSYTQHFDLVCHRQYYLPVSSSLYFVGTIVGRVAGGYAADRLGRRPVFMATALLTCALGAGVAFSPTVWIFSVLRLLVGVASNAATVVGIVLWSEMTNSRHRNTLGFLFGVHESFVTPSCVVLAAYLTQDWRALHIFMTALYGAVALLHPCLLTESPLWLLSTGRVRRAVRVVCAAIRRNGRAKRFPPAEMRRVELSLRRHYRAVAAAAAEETAKGSWRDRPVVALVSRPTLRRRLAPFLFVWVVIQSGVMGLQYYSVRMRHSDPYLVAFVGCTFTLPGLVLKQCLYHFFDRRRPLAGTFALGAVVCVVGSALRAVDAPGAWNSVLATVALGASLVAQNMAYAVTAEAFPTVYRSYAMGLASGIGRAGSALATFVERLDLYVWSGLPLLVFAVLNALASVCVILMPLEEREETLIDLNGVTEAKPPEPSCEGNNNLTASSEKASESEAVLAEEEEEEEKEEGEEKKEQRNGLLV